MKNYINGIFTCLICLALSSCLSGGSQSICNYEPGECSGGVPIERKDTEISLKFNDIGISAFKKFGIRFPADKKTETFQFYSLDDLNEDMTLDLLPELPVLLNQFVSVDFFLIYDDLTINHSENFLADGEAKEVIVRLSSEMMYCGEPFSTAGCGRRELPKELNVNQELVKSSGIAGVYVRAPNVLNVSYELSIDSLGWYSINAEREGAGQISGFASGFNSEIGRVEIEDGNLVRLWPFTCLSSDRKQVIPGGCFSTADEVRIDSLGNIVYGAWGAKK